MGLGRVKTRSSFCVGTIFSILRQKNQKHRTYMPGNRTLSAEVFTRPRSRAVPRNSLRELAAGGRFDLYIAHPMALPVVPASLPRITAV